MLQYVQLLFTVILQMATSKQVIEGALVEEKLIQEEDLEIAFRLEKNDGIGL